VILPPAPPAEAYVPPTYENGSTNRSTTAKWIFITLAMLILLAIGIAGVIYAIVKQPAKKPRRKARRRMLDNDDY